MPLVRAQQGRNHAHGCREAVSEARRQSHAHGAASSPRYRDAHGLSSIPDDRRPVRIWDLLIQALALIRSAAPDIAIRAEVGFEEDRLDRTTSMSIGDPEFNAKHQSSFPEFAGPGLSTNIGWLGLEHVLHSGGSGFFPQRLVSNHLKSGRLYQVHDVPLFRLLAYVVYPVDCDKEIFDIALTVIRRATSETLASSQAARSP